MSLVSSKNIAIMTPENDLSVILLVFLLLLMPIANEAYWRGKNNKIYITLFAPGEPVEQ